MKNTTKNTILDIIFATLIFVNLIGAIVSKNYFPFICLILFVIFLELLNISRRKAVELNFIEAPNVETVNKLSKFTPEARAKISEAMKKRWADKKLKDNNK